MHDIVLRLAPSKPRRHALGPRRCRFRAITGSVWGLALGFILLSAAVVLPDMSAAAETRLSLVMIDARDCIYCRRWHAEVGKVYPKSPEGRRAPLVVIEHGSPEARRFGSVGYTPTFILVAAEGREIGRIIGYPGADFFWGLLQDLLRKAGVSEPAAPAPTGGAATRTRG
ncbi:MAG: hypothetical protein NW205_05235 [Hyphomicrobiaceae bacterium]|nr:hypothetical protein [Hyphomicrobiaceae bacterium]